MYASYIFWFWIRVKEFSELFQLRNSRIDINWKGFRNFLFQDNKLWTQQFNVIVIQNELIKKWWNQSLIISQIFVYFFNIFLYIYILYFLIIRNILVSILSNDMYVLAYTHTFVYPLNIFHHLIKTTNEMCAIYFWQSCMISA